MGFVITVVTLVATYLQARRARSSADQARDAAKAAAESATKQVAKSSLIGEVNAAIELARAISRIHNSENQGELL